MKKRSFLYVFCYITLFLYNSHSYGGGLGDAMESAERGTVYCNGRPLPAGQRTCNYGNKSVDVYSERNKQLSEHDRALMKKAWQPIEDLAEQLKNEE